MSKEQTVASELSVAFGILELDPLTVLSEDQVAKKFCSTLEYPVYLDFTAIYTREEKRYSRFIDIGLNLKSKYNQFHAANLTELRWNGPNHESSTVSLPIDLIVSNTPISIKDNSNVIYNRSPYNMFLRLPQGLADLDRSPNWFIHTAPDEYQYLYEYAQNTWGREYPTEVAVYHKSIDDTQREMFRNRIKVAEKTKASEFAEYQRRYLNFCRVVSQNSAVIFNEHLAASQSQRGRSAVNELLLRNLLRLGEVNCIICGLDKSRSFAAEMPRLSDWQRHWSVRSCVASQDQVAQREQPVVKLTLEYENKTNRQQRRQLEFEVQIRWSHGRFCGNPEAKLYKKFQWAKDVPFVKMVYSEQPYRKTGIVGDGGFAVVYEAFHSRRKHKVAFKELSLRGQDLNEVQRFAREVRILSPLKHGNIVPVLDASLESSPPWFVMPLARCNLAEAVHSKNGLPASEAEAAFRQILAGITFAHKNGIVHRDLKPENILVFGDDKLMVSDFGLGKQLDPASLDWGLTGSSESLGSLHYAAPEQLQSAANADNRTDIYSLGKILYFCLTNEAPYPHMNLSLLANKYALIVGICTKEDPNERFQSVDALLKALDS